MALENAVENAVLYQCSKIITPGFRKRHKDCPYPKCQDPRTSNIYLNARTKTTLEIFNKIKYCWNSCEYKDKCSSYKMDKEVLSEKLRA